jgi:hypothetical protein
MVDAGTLMVVERLRYTVAVGLEAILLEGVYCTEDFVVEDLV